LGLRVYLQEGNTALHWADFFGQRAKLYRVTDYYVMVHHWHSNSMKKSYLIYYGLLTVQ